MTNLRKRGKTIPYVSIPDILQFIPVSLVYCIAKKISITIFVG